MERRRQQVTHIRGDPRGHTSARRAPPLRFWNARLKPRGGVPGGHGTSIVEAESLRSDPVHSGPYDIGGLCCAESHRGGIVVEDGSGKPDHSGLREGRPGVVLPIRCTQEQVRTTCCGGHGELGVFLDRPLQGVPLGGESVLADLHLKRGGRVSQDVEGELLPWDGGRHGHVRLGEGDGLVDSLPT